MSSTKDSEVSVFWDYASCPLPSTTYSGYAAVNNIRTISQRFGSVKSFRMYIKPSGPQNRIPRTTLSELQCSGVSLIDCPEIDGYTMGTGMMLVDMVAHALDNSASSTLVLISGDRVLSYALSILRMRCYRVVVIAPDTAHFSVLAQASLSFNWGVDVLYPGGSSPTGNLPKYPGGTSTRDRWKYGGLPPADGDDHQTPDPSNFKFQRRSQTTHVNGLADSGSDQSDQEFRMPTARATMKPRNLPETFSSPLLSREAPPSQATSVQTPPTRTFATRAVSTDSILVSPPKIYESRAVSPVRDPAQVRVTRATSPVPQQAPDPLGASLPQSPPPQPVPQVQAEPTRTYATQGVSTDPVSVSPLEVYASEVVSAARPPAQVQATSAASLIAEAPDRPITNIPKSPSTPTPLSDPAPLVVDKQGPPSATTSHQTAFPPSPSLRALPSEPPAAVEPKSESVGIHKVPSMGTRFLPPKSKVERVDEQPLPSFRFASISNTFIPDPEPTQRSPAAPKHPLPDQRPSLETLQRLQSLGSRTSSDSPGLNPSGGEFVPKQMTWTFPSPTAPSMAQEQERSGPPTFGTLRPLPLGIQQPPPSHFGDDYVERHGPPTHFSAPPTNRGHLQPDLLPSGSSTVAPSHLHAQGADGGLASNSPNIPQAPPPTPLMPLKPPIPFAARVAPGPPSVVPPAFKQLVRVLRMWSSRDVIRPLQSTVSLTIGGKPTYQLAGVLKFSHYLAIAKQQGLIFTGGSTPREWVALDPRWANVPCD